MSPETTRSVRLAGWLAVALVLHAGLLGLATVWVRYQVAATASDIRRLEVSIQQSERNLREVDGRIGEALNPSFLLSQNDRFDLRLRPAAEPQVIRVPVALGARLAAKRDGVLPVFGPAGEGFAEAAQDNPPVLLRR